jgi:hypothetical protein
MLAPLGPRRPLVLGDVLHEVDDAAAVAVLVVVPRHQLDEVRGQRDTCTTIHPQEGTYSQRSRLWRTASP